MFKTYCELFSEVERANTELDKIAIFKRNESPQLRGLLKINFNKSVDMGLPEGVPPFRKNDAPLGTEHEFLHNTYKKFYIWLDPTQTISRVKKESLFVSMLETLHETEANLMCFIKDKKLTELYPSINEELVRKAFPNILPPV